MLLDLLCTGPRCLVMHFSTTSSPLSRVLLVLLAVLCVAPLRAQTTGGSASPVTPVVYANYVTAWSYMSVYEDEAAEWTGTPSTLGREGAAYGDEGEEYGFLVGGSTLHGSTQTAYGDIWLLNITSDTFVSCGSLSPTATLYYGQAEWNEANEQLVVVGGVQSAPSAAQETYFTGLYVLQFPAATGPAPNCAGLQVTNVPVTPAVPGRKFHSIEIIDGVMYVFGGYNANTALTQSQLFYTVNIATGASAYLNTNSAYFPVGIIEPAILEDEGEMILFFYSGLSAPAGSSGATFPPAGTMYRYSWESNEWLPPVMPQLGSSSESLLGYPQFVYACHTHTLDDEHWFFAGGQDGQGNSLDTVVHFDMSTDSTVGVSVVTIQYGELPHVGVEHCALLLGVGGELIVLTGYSEGIDVSPQGAYPTSIFESVLPLIAQNAPVDSYSSFIQPEDATAEWAATNLPPIREGAAYGCDGTNVFFAGGAVLSAENVVAYTDVWSMNAPGDKYVSYSTQLPGHTYFGTGQFYNSALYVWGGRTNTVGSGALNTYSASMYKVDFSQSPPAASTVTFSGGLAPSLVGTQHASSVTLNGAMYVWGGTNGATGTSVPSSSQQWFSVNLGSGAISQESASCSNTVGDCDYPSAIWVNPVLFTSSAGRYIYLYSGLQSDYATWNNNFDVFIYDTQAQLWSPDVIPLVSPYSAGIPQYPNMAFGVVTSSTDGNHWLVVGGTYGDTSASGAGSHSHIYHIDATPLVSNGVTGQPIFSVLSSQLSVPTESAVGGLTQNNRELIVFSGAQYFNSELNYPIAYTPLLLEIQQAGFEAAVGAGSCSSSSSLSGGQIAGIVVGSILGTALIVGFIVYWAMRNAGAKGGPTNYHSHRDGSSEMSTRANDV